MSMIVDLDGIQPQITRADMPDSEAEALIEQAAASAAAQVRERLRLARQVEKDLFERRQGIREEQEADGRNNRARWEQEAEESRLRNQAEIAANKTGSGIKTIPRRV